MKYAALSALRHPKMPFLQRRGVRTDARGAAAARAGPGPGPEPLRDRLAAGAGGPAVRFATTRSGARPAGGVPGSCCRGSPSGELGRGEARGHAVWAPKTAAPPGHLEKRHPGQVRTSRRFIDWDTRG